MAEDRDENERRAWAYMEWRLGFKGPKWREAPEGFIGGWMAAKQDTADMVVKRFIQEFNEGGGSEPLLVPQSDGDAVTKAVE